MPSYSHLNRNRMKKHTNLTNEITGSTHYDKKTDPVLVAVGLMILVCGIIYLVAF